VQRGDHCEWLLVLLLEQLLMLLLHLYVDLQLVLEDLMRPEVDS
jgi:hypothetical protein